MATTKAQQFSVDHVFVLMFENRSLDHMLGFSGITGTDARTGQVTKLNGLSGSESNTYSGKPYGVQTPANFVMPLDPAHEFTDVVEQLCGQGATYPPGAAYPKVSNSGFVANYARSPSAGT